MKGAGSLTSLPHGALPPWYRPTDFAPRLDAIQPGCLRLEVQQTNHDRRKDRSGHGGHHVPEEAFQLHSDNPPLRRERLREVYIATHREAKAFSSQKKSPAGRQGMGLFADLAAPSDLVQD